MLISISHVSTVNIGCEGGCAVGSSVGAILATGIAVVVTVLIIVFIRRRKKVTVIINFYDNYIM